MVQSLNNWAKLNQGQEKVGATHGIQGFGTCL